MGRIFTWSDIEGRRTPTLEQFTLVMQQLHWDLGNNRCIKAALVCGSVIRGDHTVRSDIDCVVHYHNESVREAFSVMHALSHYAAHHHVPVTFVTTDSAILGTRMHHFGPSFLEHLRRSMHAGGIIKGNPLEAVAASVSEQEELESYLRVKYYSLQESWAEYLAQHEERRMATLKKFYEAPIHVARKALAHNGRLSDDSKAFIRRQYTASMPPHLVERLASLEHIDGEYSQEVKRQLDHASEVDYRAMIGYLEDHALDVIRFVQDNLVYVAATARQ